MYRILAPLFLALACLSLPGHAEPPSPLSVAQRQLDTYNAQDIDGFAATFAEQALIFRRIGDAEPSMSGRAEIREAYAKLFKDNPNNRSTLLGRVAEGRYVIDHELITGRGADLRLVAIYEIENGLIQRAWFAR